MPANTTTKAAHFKALHDNPGIFVIPNPWCAGAATILQSIGFKALATTSAGLAFSIAKRDGEAAVTLDQTLDNAREIVEATDLPVSADLENGFADDPESVARTIERAAEVGLVGASIEDATFNDDNPLYPRTLAVERIAAAAQAAQALPFHFTLTARTEGFIRNRPDLDETLERLTAFQAAGADVLYAPGLPDLETITLVCTTLTKPVNTVIGVGSARYTLAQLASAGVRRVSTGSALTRAAFEGFLNAAKEIHDQETFNFTHDALKVTDWNDYFPTSSS